MMLHATLEHVPLLNCRNRDVQNTVGQCIVWYGLKILKGFEIDQSPPQTARYIRQAG